jgi:hypothetical protein
MPDCLQPSWPQVHMSSVLSPMPSQWALQYFSFPPGTQLQAGFAHFFGVLAMLSPPARQTRLLRHSGHRRFRCQVDPKGC